MIFYKYLFILFFCKRERLNTNLKTMSKETFNKVETNNLKWRVWEVRWPKGAKYVSRNTQNICWNTQNLSQKNAQNVFFKYTKSFFNNAKNVSWNAQFVTWTTQNLSWNSQNVFSNTQIVLWNIQKVPWNAQNIQRGSKNLTTWNTQIFPKLRKMFQKLHKMFPEIHKTFLSSFPDLWYFSITPLCSSLTRYRRKPREWLRTESKQKGRWYCISMSVWTVTLRLRVHK